jgi:hypothetical protein
MGGRIVVQPTFGLCNRLLVVSSFAVLARRTRRELEVCWTTGEGWSNEDLSDLFENHFPRVSVQQFERDSTEGLALDAQVTVTGTGGLDEDWRYSDGPGLTALFDLLAYPVVTYRGYRPGHALLAPEDRHRVLPGFGRELVEELRTWLPIPSIRARVAEIVSEFDETTVGVHIRRGDAMTHPQYAAQYRRSSDVAFIRSMERIVRSRPGTKFFLATDSQMTQQLLREHFGSRILSNELKQFVPSQHGAPKDNQYDAVIDLFALAETGTILGTYYSTFSQTAAMLRGGRLIVVLDDSWLVRSRRILRLGRHEAIRRARTTIRRLAAT